MSVIHHAANHGIKFSARKQIDFAFHVHLLWFDEATIRFALFSRLGVARIRRRETDHGQFRSAKQADAKIKPAADGVRKASGDVGGTMLEALEAM